jgi:hypothetical protein
MEPLNPLTLRKHPRSEATDRAILDLLELQSWDMAPGEATTAELQQRWHCSQPSVSRRLAAIGRLPGWRVVVAPGRGARAWIGPALPPAVPMPPSPRERWERIRQKRNTCPTYHSNTLRCNESAPLVHPITLDCDAM